jgi:hypothetical protein
MSPVEFYCAAFLDRHRAQLLAMKRVAILLGGAPHGSEEQVIPPSQHLRIARYSELSTIG